VRSDFMGIRIDPAGRSDMEMRGDSSNRGLLVALDRLRRGGRKQVSGFGKRRGEMEVLLREEEGLGPVAAVFSEEVRWPVEEGEEEDYRSIRVSLMVAAHLVMRPGRELEEAFWDNTKVWALDMLSLEAVIGEAGKEVLCRVVRRRRQSRGTRMLWLLMRLARFLMGLRRKKGAHLLG
jgi:hypothetical protein